MSTSVSPPVRLLNVFTSKNLAELIIMRRLCLSDLLPALVDQLPEVNIGMTEGGYSRAETVACSLWATLIPLTPPSHPNPGEGGGGSDTIIFDIGLLKSGFFKGIPVVGESVRALFQNGYQKFCKMSLEAISKLLFKA